MHDTKRFACETGDDFRFDSFAQPEMANEFEPIGLQTSTLTSAMLLAQKGLADWG
jgi:hypothetical protein